LPDYQGIGIGRKFLNIIAKKYADEGFDLKITTSAKNLIYALRRDENWIMQRYSVNKKSKTANRNCRKMVNTVRDNCKTASFYFKNC
jgi:phage protein